MPPLNPVNKVIRVDLFFTVGVQTRVRDRFFLAFTGAGPAVADLNTLASTIATAWGTNMSPQQHNSCTLTQVELTDLTSATGAQAFFATNKTGSLAGTGTAPAAGVALVLKFKIARRYRGGHPRFYMPGPSMGNLADSEHWTVAYAASAASGFSSFIAAAELTPPVAVGTLTHVNVGYFSGFTVVTNPITHRARNVPNALATPRQDLVLSYTGNPIVGSQRRRNGQSP